MMFTSVSLHSQVGVGTITPEASSALDVFSTSKGFLMPRLSTEERDGILLPATGLMIYNRTLNDGQLNVGTPLAPIWTGIQGQTESTTVDSVTEGDIISNSSTDDLLVSGMTLSPSSGTYLTLFNAMMSGAESFSSDKGADDVNALYNNLMSLQGAPHTFTGGQETLTPGVYDLAGATTISGTITLNAQNDPNALFVIRVPAAFATAVNTTVELTNGGSADNIFWVVVGAITTGATTTMTGNLVGKSTIALGATAVIEGRMFSTGAALSMGASSTVTLPTGTSSQDFGVLSSFVMFTASGAIAGSGAFPIIGDVGTALGAATAFSGLIGDIYLAGTTSLEAPATSYSIYKNGIEVPNSSRTINVLNSVVNLQAMVTVSAGEAIEIRWKVDTSESTLSSRTLSLIRSGD